MPKKVDELQAIEAILAMSKEERAQHVANARRRSVRCLLRDNKAKVKFLCFNTKGKSPRVARAVRAWGRITAWEVLDPEQNNCVLRAVSTNELIEAVADGHGDYYGL